MKAKFTHKKFTLVAGIVVAIIIMLTLWLNPVLAESGEVSRKLLPPVAKPATKAVIEKTIITILDVIQ